MEFVYRAEEWNSAENTFLLTNGLGGYTSVTGAFSVSRCDQGILIAAQTAPNVRLNLVHRIREKLCLGTQAQFLSTQKFADGKPPEDGIRWLRRYTMAETPCWEYAVEGISVERRLCMAYGQNTSAVLYHIENQTLYQTLLL